MTLTDDIINDIHDSSSQSSSSGIASGLPVSQPVFYEDYWSFSQVMTWYLPDGKQYIEFAVMNEGKKAEFQRSTNRDIRINRHSGDASIQNDVAAERHSLLKNSVTGWNMLIKDKNTGGFNPVPYTRQMFDQWLQGTNPKLIEDLEFAVRKANPWLNADQSVVEIDKEISRLQDLREQAVIRESGEDSSSIK